MVVSRGEGLVFYNELILFKEVVPFGKDHVFFELRTLDNIIKISIYQLL